MPSFAPSQNFEFLDQVAECERSGAGEFGGDGCCDLFGGLELVEVFVGDGVGESAEAALAR